MNQAKIKENIKNHELWLEGVIIFLAFTVFKNIGFGLLVWGARQLVLACRDDDVNDRARAVSCLIIGAGLFGLRFFLMEFHLFYSFL